MTSHEHPAQRTGGFTLVEVMVSMTLLAIASLAIAPMLLRTARVASATGNAAYQTATMSGEVAKVDAIPFDLLAPGTTCVTITTPPFPHTRCTTVNSISAKTKEVTVVITPSGNSLLHPITTTVTRTVSGNGNPLKTQ